MKEKLTVQWCWENDYSKIFIDKFVTTPYVVSDSIISDAVLLDSGKVLRSNVEKALIARHGRNAVLRGYGCPMKIVNSKLKGWWMYCCDYDMTPELEYLRYWGA